MALTKIFKLFLSQEAVKGFLAKASFRKGVFRGLLRKKNVNDFRKEDGRAQQGWGTPRDAAYTPAPEA